MLTDRLSRGGRHQTEAAQGLAELGDPRAADTWRALAHDPRLASGWRVGAARELAELGDPARGRTPGMPSPTTAACITSPGPARLRSWRNSATLAPPMPCTPAPSPLAAMTPTGRRRPASSRTLRIPAASVPDRVRERRRAGRDRADGGARDLAEVRGFSRRRPAAHPRR